MQQSFEGIYTQPRESLLATRAMDFLAGGPAEVSQMISAVCQQPGTPRIVAEHMAMTLLGGDSRFRRLEDGRWALREHAPVPYLAVSQDLLEDIPFVVVDVETTGGSAYRGHRLTEIGAVVVQGGTVREQERFEQLINPERPIPPYITRLTNISWGMVKDQPSFSQVCDRFLEFIDDKVFVAHNASFDWRFLSAEVERVSGRRLHGRRLCTVRLARRLLPQLARRNLASVARHYGVDMAAHDPSTPVGRHRGRDAALVAHTAAGDAVATAHVLLGLLRDAGQRGCVTWDDLDALVSARTGRARRRRGYRSGPPAPVDRDTTA